MLWIERVAIAEPGVRDRELTEAALTYNLARYLRGRRLFDEVRIPPGAVAPGDWVAALRIRHCVERARPPASAYLYSILTLGLYTWLGTPTRLHWDIDVALDVRDGSARPVGSATFQESSERSATVTGATAQLTFFLDQRARMIDELFDRILENSPKEPS